MIRTFEFVQERGNWFFYDPDYALRSGGTGALTNVLKEGFDTFLQAVGKNALRVRVQCSDVFFDGADELVLTQVDKEGRGGYYLLRTLQGKPYVLLIRFIDVQAYFGSLPEYLYLKAEAVF